MKTRWLSVGRSVGRRGRQQLAAAAAATSCAQRGDKWRFLCVAQQSSSGGREGGKEERGGIRPTAESVSSPASPAYLLTQPPFNEFPAAAAAAASLFSPRLHITQKCSLPSCILIGQISRNMRESVAAADDISHMCCSGPIPV